MRRAVLGKKLETETERSFHLAGYEVEGRR